MHGLAGMGERGNRKNRDQPCDTGTPVIHRGTAYPRG
jgi:hypothetical protein